MSTQRKVSKNLGRNNTHDHERIYNHIETIIGKTKECNFGHVRGSNTGVKHEGEPKVPIREFETKGVSVSDSGDVIIKKGDGLQGFCKICSKRRRRKRLEMSKEKNKDGYKAYEKNYNKTTKVCSQCKQDEPMTNFNLSPGMECGLHNVCKKCSKEYGESVGDRFIKYRPDGKYTYKKTAINQHDDHHMPLAFGGTNEKVNHRLIPKEDNLSKSSNIPYNDVNDIPEELLCERWRPILKNVKEEKGGCGEESITLFKSRISAARLEENKIIFAMEDSKIEDVFKKYNKKYNYRKNTKRCVDKFKQYCSKILKLKRITQV